jgi:hypothetical protein
MAWPITDWSGNPDWAAIANVSAFVEAVNERLAVTYTDPLPTPLPAKAVGDDVQAAAWIASMQEAVEGYLTRFVVYHPPGYYEGGSLPVVYADLAELFSTAGLATSTWRAYTTHPDDAGVDQARGIQAGDIIGPWLFEDLQKVLNVMVLTYIDSGGLGYEAEGKIGDFLSPSPGGTWAAAKTGAEADYDAYTDTPETHASHGSTGYNTPLDAYYANISRVRERTTASALSTEFAHAVEFYAVGLPQPLGGVYADNGDAVHPEAYGLWLLNTSAATTDADVTSDWLGSVGAYPPWCPEPGMAEQVGLGWAAFITAAVVRWEFVYLIAPVAQADMVQAGMFQP